MSKASWYSIRKVGAVAMAAAAAAAGAASAAARGAEIWIYADIGESWWEETVSAKTLCAEIAALQVDQITVRLNSYGGSVSDGIAIYNALKNHPAAVTTCVDGIAASVASLIAQAGDRREVAENAMVMVHAPWAYAAGNAGELRQAADVLDAWSVAMAQTYARASGKTAEDVLAQWLDGENHWFTAAEAVAAGLADEAVAALPVMASATRFDWTAQRPGARQPSHPAAAAAATGAPMSHTTTTAAPNNATALDVQAAAEQARREEAQRQADVRAAYKAYAREGAEQQQLLERALAQTDMTVQAFKAALLEVNAKGTTPIAGGYVATVEDEGDKRLKAIRGALEIRAGLAKNEGANPWRARSLLEVARACLAQAGVSEAHMPEDKLTLVAMAFTHGTSDFPNILANVANKAMLKGYEESPETFGAWTNTGSLPDFKQGRSVDLGSIGTLRQVRPGAEYKYVTFGERAEVYALATYGEVFGIDRQTVINDDVDAFSAIPRKMGRAARRTVGDLVYSQLTSNPTMGDSIALFHASHANLLAAAGIATASVDAMRTAMAIQRDAGQTSGALNIDLAYLIVPKALEGQALTVRDSQVEVSAANTTAGARNNTAPNTQRGRFEVVADARLDAASTSIWYGAGNPAMHDTVTVFYLDGNEAPFLDQQNGWMRDGVEMKVRIDAAAKAMDFRALARNG